MSVDYDDLINRTWEEVPEEELLPGGGWLLQGTVCSLVKPKEEGQALKVLFNYKAKQPLTVPEDLIEEMGDYDFSINALTHTIWVETAKDWDNVRKHLAKHGIEMSGPILNEQKKLAFAKAFKGSEVVAEVGQRSFENNAGETVWQNSLSKFQAVTE